MSSKRLILISCIAVPGMLSWGLFAHAQVSIRERISIHPAPVVSLMDARLYQDYFLAPKAGFLSIKYIDVLKLQRSSQPQIPWDQHFDVRIRDSVRTLYPGNGTTIGSGVWSYIYSICDGRYVSYYYINYTLADQMFGPVAANDTVRMLYHGEFDNPTLQVIDEGYTQWGIQLRLGTDDPCTPDTLYHQEFVGLELSYADTVVSITRPVADTVYPTYPGNNNYTDKMNFIDLEVSTNFRDTARSNVWVKFSQPTVVDSGGHTHTASDRPLGRFVVKKTSDPLRYDTLQTFERATDSNGKLRFRFLSSYFGGREVIKVSLKSDTTKCDTISILTRVPGFGQLPGGSNYIKVGGTCEHHGPGGAGECASPDEDHYGIPELLSAIPKIADKWAAKYPTLSLRVNDMSLKFGGKFDIDGDWLRQSKNHQAHRVGINADLPVSYMNADTVKEGQLIRIIKSVCGVEPYDERWTDSTKTVRRNGPHFHIYAK